MRQKLIGRSSARLLIPLSMIALAGLGLSVAGAQTSSHTQIVQPANATSGSGEYYVEFRSRQSWDYGHTFVVFGRVGETPRKSNVAGLSPKGDDPKMWVMGHYVPVPSDTGWTDGDLEDRYITSRYRVLMNKAQYDRVVAYIRQLQATHTTWSVELYNCNAFVADIARFMGLKAPSSSWIYPKVFVSNMRKINPTRDGRAMINAGLIHPGSPPAGSASPPHVTIGAVRVSNRPASSEGRLPGE